MQGVSDVMAQEIKNALSQEFVSRVHCWLILYGRVRERPPYTTMHHQYLHAHSTYAKQVIQQ
eukprot:XP_001690090.1 predicted protein [Chlamydomonas reinhardtii]